MNNNKQLVFSNSYTGCDMSVYVMVNPYSTYLRDMQRKQENAVIDEWEDARSIAALTNMNAVTYNPYKILNVSNSPYPNLLFPYNVPPSDYSSRLAEASMSPLHPSQFPVENIKGHDADKNNTTPFLKLANLQTLSYSVYRDAETVRSIGFSQPRGYTRGPYTYAGTMISVVILESAYTQLLKYAQAYSSDIKFLNIMELPPLDVFVSFTNEVGNLSKMAIYGIQFLNEGQVMSVQDLFTENSVNYLARYIEPMVEIKDFDAFNPYRSQDKIVSDGYRYAMIHYNELRNYFK